MGGRLDATNVITPEVCVITNIGFDHQEFLGSTLSSIAREKAGIIKEGVPVVTGALQPVAQGILKTTCMNKAAPLYRFKSDFRVRRNSNVSFRYLGISRQFSVPEPQSEGTTPGRQRGAGPCNPRGSRKKGLLSLRPEIVERSMHEVRWPARLEILDTNPTIVLDGAHNPQGAESLRDALKVSFNYGKLHLVMGIMADKDILGILRRLLPMAETAIFTRPRYARATNPDDIRKMARPYIQKYYVIPEPASAIEEASIWPDLTI